MRRLVLPLALLTGVCLAGAGSLDSQNASFVVLSVAKAGAGSGTVLSSPPGIDCGSDCAQFFLQAVEVRLTVVPDGGSRFGGWTGPMDCLDGTVVMTGSMVCTATFDTCSIPVDVTVTGETVNGTESFHACNNLTVGPSVVVGSTGRADFVAGNSAGLVGPSRVEAGGRLSVHIGSSNWGAGSGQLGEGGPGEPEGTGQDAYEFQVSEGMTFLVLEAAPDPNLDPEIYLYAPGAVGQGQMNLLTGTPFGLDAAGVGATEGAVLTVSAPGVYTLAIEDGRPPASRVAGLYTVVVNSDKPISPLTLVVDEGPDSD